ncbi:MAG TPA: zf-TFIIB domain-containing protein [Holophagaceae bacterium]|nr:zf-TFIIB domain-containing protein [Holophagaceae bacterium]
MPVKPSTPEETFFAQQELERRRSLARAREERLRDDERRMLKERHWMRCPKCGMELLEIEHLGHRVDQCSACRGLWLDAGELEALTGAGEGGFLGHLRKVFWR